MLPQHQKFKSVGKINLPRGERYTKFKLQTLDIITKIVGGTLGPYGCPVVLERYEDLPPIVTKDGVTVFKALGFQDSVQQTILDLVRDAAQRTGKEAGDSTTTVTILTEAFVRLIHQYCEKHVEQPPQAVARELEKLLKNKVFPKIEEWAVYPEEVDFSDPENAGYKMLKGVAQVSANGDEEMAQAVMDCFAIVGDYGNVTISEESGPSGYKAEQLKGYPVHFGLDDIGRFWSKFINDAGRQACSLEKTFFIVYNGKLNSIEPLYNFLAPMAMDKNLLSTGDPEAGKFASYNLVIAATGFNEHVLANLAANFPHQGTLNIFPLVVPKIGILKGQEEVLIDIATITGATLFDPLSKPLESGVLEDMGGPIEQFECTRRMTSIIGIGPKEGVEDAIEERIYQLQTQAEQAVSDLDRSWLEERIGKISNGIAKLVVYGASNGEVKEKKDRAEDAICAIRGALRHGVLPGGCWTFNRVLSETEVPKSKTQAAIWTEIVKPALHAPFKMLLSNGGIPDSQVSKILADLEKEGWAKTFEANERVLADPHEIFLYDSRQAVESALRNSLSVSIVLGTSGGLVCYGRDHELETARAAKLYDAKDEMDEAEMGWQSEKFGPDGG